MRRLPPIDYLIIGHVTRDLTPDGDTLGGTVAYAGLTAHALGARVGVVTACSSDLPLELPEALAVHCLPSAKSTTFQNTNHEGTRRQRLLARADDLRIANIPQEWRAVPLVHFGPVADEVDLRLISAFPRATKMATPQGWLRRWDANGNVRQKPLNGLLPYLARLDMLVVSPEDLIDEGEMGALTGLVPLLAITLGAQGADIVWRGERRHLPAPPAREIDPTGAGDIFAAAFAMHYHKNHDAWEAARFANEVASDSVRRPGLEGPPVSARLPQPARQA